MSICDGSYKIERKCRKPVFPTRICKDNLVTLFCFEAKGKKGYGDWIWAPKHGKVAAICHKNYETNQAYLALVASPRKGRRKKKCPRILCLDFIVTLRAYAAVTSPAILDEFQNS
ncbi:unnamed protein product [Gongylonema pulchrum]|uniref:Uncharacterized protein n=1 Tax=Gongylonema pulchrum TaxID=637853 RepID=A0A3P7RHJ9_9BILA|nr:unnamed protein product [Gongylonema pulchrum]